MTGQTLFAFGGISLLLVVILLRLLLLIIAVCGLFFYAAVLGLGPVDPYSWGHINTIHGLLSPVLFLLILFSLMFFAFSKDYSQLLLCLVGALLVYSFGLLESRNLWDYLFDPLVFIYSLFMLPAYAYAALNLKK